jgi:hypothetical protein
MGLFKILNLGESLRGKVCKVQWQDGRTTDYLNLWQFLNHLRGKSFVCYSSGPRPDLETVRKQVAENPNDAHARLWLGVLLAGQGSPDDGYKECREAIALVSKALVGVEDARILSFRSFAHRQAATILEQMGRHPDAYPHWKQCADDLRIALPERYLRENPYYLEAMEKLNSSPTE